MRSHWLIPAVVATSLVVACLAPAAAAQGLETRLETDIVYATRGEVRLLLDVERPAAQGEPRPALVFLHDRGEEFLPRGNMSSAVSRSGSKRDLRAEIRMAAERGYVGVAVSYRLPHGSGSADQFPAQLHDVKAAVRFLRANAGRYGIDPERIGVVGCGFGGYLALMAAFTIPRDGLEGDAEPSGASSKVHAAVAAGAPVDWIVAMDNTASALAGFRAFIAALLGGLPSDVPDRYRKANATGYFGFSDAPVLAIYGGMDVWADPEQVGILTDRMVAVGARHSVLVLPAASGGEADLLSPNTDYPMWSFLKLYLDPR